MTTLKEAITERLNKLDQATWDGEKWIHHGSTQDLLPILLEVVTALQDIGFKTLVSGEDLDGKGGACRIAIGNSRNEKILLAQSALSKLEQWARGKG